MKPSHSAARSGTELMDGGRGNTSDFESTRRRLTQRQADVVSQLVHAAEEETDLAGYAGLTVRSVARRAGVAPATAYTYFSSKDHLLAEVLWRRMRSLPPVDGGSGRPTREVLADAVAEMVLLTAESPALVDACTIALLSGSPDVKHLRDRIGSLIRRRLSSAVGPDADPLVVPVLQSTYSGALLMAGMGHISFLDIPGFIASAAELMMERSEPTGTPGATR